LHKQDGGQIFTFAHCFRKSIYIIQDPSVIDISNLVRIFQTPHETRRTTKRSKVKVTFRWAQIRSVLRLTKNYDRDKFTHAQLWYF